MCNHCQFENLYTYSDAVPKKLIEYTEESLEESLESRSLFIIHVKQINGITPAILDALKNKAAILEDLRTKIGANDA